MVKIEVYPWGVGVNLGTYGEVIILDVRESDPPGYSSFITSKLDQSSKRCTTRKRNMPKQWFVNFFRRNLLPET